MRLFFIKKKVRLKVGTEIINVTLFCCSRPWNRNYRSNKLSLLILLRNSPIFSMNLDLPENFESIIYLDFFLSDKRNDNLNTVAPEEFVSSFFILSYRTRLKVFYAEVKEFFNP